jgi:predicted dehydrogenase
MSAERRSRISGKDGRKRFILIGAGGFGRVWVEALSQCDRARCVALVDINPEALAAAGKVLKVPVKRRFADLSAAMGVPFDAAVVCIPPAARMPVYRTLAEAGKGILCEKPLADSMEQALAARALAKDKAIPFVVSQNYRYFDAVQALKSLLELGRHGRPMVAHVDFFKYPRFFGFREEMPYPLTIDMSIHHFDLARFLLSADPARVTGASWNPPWSVMAGDPCATLVFEMTGGARLVYNGSWTSLRPPSFQTAWSGSWYIECEDGFVCMADDKIRSAHWSLDADGKPAWEPVDDTIEVARRIPHPQRHVLEQFIAQMEGGPAPPTTVDDNVKSMAMVFGAVRAFKEKTSIDLREMLRQ